MRIFSYRYMREFIGNFGESSYVVHIYEVVFFYSFSSCVVPEALCLSAQ